MTVEAQAIAHLSAVADGDVVRLPADALRAESWHRWSRRELDALTLALAAERPLLVRGEPGTGKTQLARAAATVLSRALHAITVDGRTEPQDLLYRLDAVARLAAAQAGVTLAETDYWDPGPLWRAFDWASASAYGSCRGLSWPGLDGHVVLIDEIDKAESDLPNGLLEILGQRSQYVPALRRMIGGPGTRQPLVLVTTNEERELPAAFLRRCIVLNLQPEPGASYRDWLIERGAAHFGPRQGEAAKLGDEILSLAALQLDADRQRAEHHQLPPPGAAEYIDLLAALVALAPGDGARQRLLLDQLSAYAFVKHVADPARTDLTQHRPPDTAARESPQRR